MSLDDSAAVDTAFARRGQVVLDWLDELVAGLPTPAGHRRLLGVAVEGGRRQLAGWPALPAPTLPLLVHAAAGGDETGAVPLAGACTLVYLGADLLDDIADDEVPDAWSHVDPGRTTLVAATLLAALPLLALARLEVHESVAAELGQLFGESLLTMSAGQHQDMSETCDVDDLPTAARAVVEAKAGAEFALFSGAAAVLAGADPDQVEAYTEYGHCVGCAAQIVSDLSDLAAPQGSPDLLNGKRTLPVAHALALRTGDQRTRLLALLDEARVSVDTHEQVRVELARSGSLAYTALVASYYRSRAEAALGRARPLESAAAVLRTFGDRLTALDPTRALDRAR